MNPVKILVLFFAMTLQSIYLDEIGFFRYLANITLKRAKTSQKTLFFYLYLTVSVLTVFTSNDMIILTFTPFICYFAKNADINPLPYLFAEFVAANTWSMMLMIGNPTNIYLAADGGISFLSYVKIMVLPTLCGGITALLVLTIVFRKMLQAPLKPQAETVKIEDHILLRIGIINLSVCTALLVVSSYIGIEMWLIAAILAVSLFLEAGIYLAVKKRKLTILWTTLKRGPWQLIPFLLSMFLLVMLLDNAGIIDKIGKLLGNSHTVLEYGITSFLSANVINNIPMSVLFGSVSDSLSDANRMSGIFAAVIGSNIGAFFTPLGALAGIMWASILKKNQVKFSYITFVRYGALISIPTLMASLLGLSWIMK